MMKRIIAVVILCIQVLLLFASCTEWEQNGKMYYSSEEPTGETAEIPVFGSKFEALQTLTSYITSEIFVDYYTEDSLREFRLLVSEVSGKFNELDIDEASRYAGLLKEAYDNLSYVAGDTPRIYISTGGAKIIKEDYIAVKITVVDKENGKYHVVANDSVLIKIRGQSTAGAAKKPYTFKYGESLPLLGMRSGKRWVLLANAFDKSLMRNKLALDFAQTLNFAYAPNGEYVELWLDGVFKGNYLLTEPVTDGKNRVDINTDKNEFLIELDHDRTEKDIVYIKTRLFGVRFKIEKPEVLKEGQLNFLKEFISNMETAINTHDHAEYGKYLDIKSFIDYHIILNYFKDVDAEFSSTNFYLKDGILYAGPPWDFDLSSGNVNPAHNNPLYRLYNNVRSFGNGSGDSAEGVWGDNDWFGELLKDEYFQEAVASRYREIQPQIVNLYIDNELGMNKIDRILNDNTMSFLRNYTNTEWSLKEKYCDMERYPNAEYIDNAEYLRSWLKSRNKWLLNYYSDK